jgi:hypothetical protein
LKPTPIRTDYSSICRGFASHRIALQVGLVSREHDKSLLRHFTATDAYNAMPFLRMALSRQTFIGLDASTQLTYASCIHIFTVVVASTQHRIQHHHHDKAEHQSSGGKCFVALAVGFRNDFVADDEQHGVNGNG